jgi:hypothetical protein
MKELELKPIHKSEGKSFFRSRRGTTGGSSFSGVMRMRSGAVIGRGGLIVSQGDPGPALLVICQLQLTAKWQSIVRKFWLEGVLGDGCYVV